MAIVRFFRQSDSFLEAKWRYYEADYWNGKKYLVQFIAVTSLPAVKIEERNKKSNSIRRQENSWQHRLISWVSSVFFGLLYAVVARLIVDASWPWKSETNVTYCCYLPWFLEIETFCLAVSQNFPVYPYKQTQVKLFIPSSQVPPLLQVTLIQSSMSESKPHKTLAQLKKLG